MGLLPAADETAATASATDQHDPPSVEMTWLPGDSGNEVSLQHRNAACERASTELPKWQHTV
eukprot:8887425-Prorocentrum_lima.AAC.1